MDIWTWWSHSCAAVKSTDKYGFFSIQRNIKGQDSERQIPKRHSMLAAACTLYFKCK